MVTMIERPADQADIRTRALQQLRAKAAYYNVYENYYAARHPLTYASTKYRNAFSRMVSQYVENMCPTVVDALADRLTVTGFAVEGATDDNDGGAGLWEIWSRNRMDRRAGETHKEAAKNGDAYVIVWPDEATNLARITPQKARTITVNYDDETESITWAAKYWQREDKIGQLNVYWPDRIEKFQTRNKVHAGYPNSANALEPFEEIVNPLGRVPVFHFANNADIASFGQSELRDVVPVQDALNKSVADLLVAMEFAAFNQRWATGMEMETGLDGKPKPTFEPGIDRIWATEGENVEFGEFAAADLDKFINVHDMFLLSIARVTKTPTHHLLINPASFPSGESLKTAESGFVSKVLDRQVAFGNVWEDVMTAAAELDNIALAGRVTAIWQDPNPRSDRDSIETAILKKQIGVPDGQLQREAGYSEDEITAMKEERDANAAASLERQQQLLNRGGMEDED